MKMKKPAIFIFAILFLLISSFIKVEKRAARPSAAPQSPAPEIEARSALAKDLVSHEILLKKNEKEPLPLASIAKIISALVILDENMADEEVAVSRDAIEAPEPSSLRVREHFKIGDLLAMVIVESSNDAISALVEHTIQKENKNRKTL